MRALLVQQGLKEALQGEASLDKRLDEKDRNVLMDKAHNAIILSLEIKVLKQVSKEKIVARVWTKLKCLYMAQSLVNRLYHKQALYYFKM